MKKIIALDTETTGFDPKSDRIIELYAAVMPDIHAPRWDVAHWVLNPGIRIPAASTEVHGFNDGDVAGKPGFASIAADVQDLLQDSVIVAYNGVKFDVPLLDAELRRAGQPGLRADHPIIDPMTYFREEVPHTLTGAVRYYLDQAHPRAHSAEWDVRMMLKVVHEQAMRGKPFGRHKFPEDWVRPWQESKSLFEKVGGDVVFAFGKHRGKPAIEHPGYLRWMLKESFPADVKAFVASVLAEVEA